MTTGDDLIRPEFVDDPYPFYARWRREHPIAYDERLGAWLVSRYADAAALLRDARFRSCRPAVLSNRRDDGLRQLCELVDGWTIFAEPPDHTRLRRLLNHALAVDFVSGRGSSIHEIAGGVLDDCGARDTFDLVTDVAAPMAVLVLADAMGLPRADRADLRAWSGALVPLIDGSLRVSSLESAQAAGREAVAYLTPIVRARAARPEPDVISRLTDRTVTGDGPTEADVVATCVFLLMAGHETTTALIGNAFAALFANRGEFDRLRHDSTIGPLAIEECLRFDSPVQTTSRVPDRDVEWSGVTFSRGVVVNVLIGSANRDPEQFADADRLDVTRTKNPHLAFGSGIHFCAGAALARLTARAAIGQIIRRFPNLTPGPDQPVRRQGEVVRGFNSFPVQI